MRHRVLAARVVVACLMTACGGGSRAPVPPPDTETGPGKAGLLACQSLVRAMDAFVACAPSEDERVIAEHLQAAARASASSTKPLEGAMVRRDMARFCLDQLAGYVPELAAKRCGHVVSATERAWLDAHRKRRTPVPAATAGSDRSVLEALSAERDRACACKTEACIDEIHTKLESRLGRLSDDASPASRAAASEMFDELTRCGQMLRIARLTAQPNEPGDQIAIKAMADRIRAEQAAAAPPPPSPPITLPGGKRLSADDCERVEDESDRDSCLFVLEEVAACKQRPDPPDARACEERVIVEYMEELAGDDEGGFEAEDEP